MVDDLRRGSTAGAGVDSETPGRTVDDLLAEARF